jgi:hypothetical protein
MASNRTKPEQAKRYAALVKAALELEKLPMTRDRYREAFRVITKRGYLPALHNFGRLRCKTPPPHAHGQGGCVLVAGEYLVRHPNDLMGMLDLVNRVEAKRRRQIDLTGFSDAAWDEFRYLETRSKRLFDWYTSEKKRTGQAPINDADRQNFGDFMGRWRQYAMEIQQYSINKDSALRFITGPKEPDEAALGGWRKEFETWERLFRAKGFEKDATIKATAPEAFTKANQSQQVLANWPLYAVPAAGIVAVLTVLAVASRSRRGQA